MQNLLAKVILFPRSFMTNVLEIPPGGVYKYTRGCADSSAEPDLCEEEESEGGVTKRLLTKLLIRFCSGYQDLSLLHSPVQQGLGDCWLH